jgi:hypothetical protein
VQQLSFDFLSQPSEMSKKQATIAASDTKSSAPEASTRNDVRVFGAMTNFPQPDSAATEARCAGEFRADVPKPSSSYENFFADLL